LDPGDQQKQDSAPPSSITTKNKYEASTTIDTQEQGLQEETTPAAHGRYHKNKQWVLVVGDSLLSGTKAPICLPDREAHKVCGLLGAKVQDVAERVPQLVKSTDYYLLLLLHVYTNDTTSHNLAELRKTSKPWGCR